MVTVQHVNATLSFDTDASNTGNAGSNVYKIGRRSASSFMRNIVLVAGIKSFDNQVSVEVVDDLELGYQRLSKDVDEIAIANQRRVNRGSVPGRLIAD